MLKFFRIIRRKLLEQRKFRNYIFYAIGEILLVMVGILLALQVNNWNQEHNQKEVERKYLLNLKYEFEENLADLNRCNENRKKTFDNILTLIYLSGDRPGSIDEKELIILLSSIYDFFSVVYEGETPVLQEIKSSGNLVSISNSELRKLLTLWNEKIGHLDGNQAEYKRYRDQVIVLIRKNGLVKGFKGVDGEWFNEISGFDFDISNRNLLASAEVGNLLYLMNSELNLFFEIMYPSTKEHIKQILQIIDQELM